MGTVCDGAYATASEFEITLATLLNQKKYDSAFFSVLWDPPHLINLAFSDVFDGKHGTSEAFVTHLVRRSCVVHQIFQHRKMLMHAMATQEMDDEFALKLTSRVCCTRFTTSQYMEFLKLLESLPLFIKTFREFQFSKIKEYQIAGYDESPTSSFPLLKKHSSDILSQKFKGTDLVKGWSIKSSESSMNEEGNAITVDQWEAREKEDVEADLQVFAADLLLSFLTIEY